MSNLLHWLKNPTREQAEFILSLVEKIKPSYAVMFSIESKDNMFRSLSSALKKLYYTLAQRSELCYCVGPNTRRITYHHFPSSHFVSRNKVYNNRYLMGFTIFKSGLAALGNLNTLKVAYFKSRMALRKEFPCDEVAIKLLEARLDSELERCAQALKHGYTFCSKPLHYKAPKSSKEFRLRVMDNVYDSLVATAFLDLYGRRIDQEFLDVSCGNRINPRRESEYIYKHFWYAWYRLFIVPILTKAPKKLKYYCHLDIASYYPSVNQARLLEKLLDLLPSKDTGLKKLVTSLICRDYPAHKKGHELPQGPVASGFLANLYLHEVDEKMRGRPNLFYRRYVDDFYLLGETEEDLRKHVSDLSKYLSQLHLRLKEDKTEYGERLELCKRYQDPTLDRLDKRLKELLRRLYAVIDNKEYQRAYRTDPGEFLLWYSKCLRELGIWLSPEWLNRKMCYQRRRLSALRALGKLLPWRKVKLPSLDNRLPPPYEWVETFRKFNPVFCASLEAN
ncbi:RNA-directed DNA polymerase [Moorellaceae bacterium AZ2]